MKFRPCIDIHNGAVKQIVGGSLKDATSHATENFVSSYDASYYARLYQSDGLLGGHIILLNPAGTPAYEKDLEQAQSALSTYPFGLQIGGGITKTNAADFLNMGASHVIVTSYVFKDGRIHWDRLKALTKTIGSKHLVLDLSCRKRDGQYYIVTDRWQRFTEVALTEATLEALKPYCDEFLIHAVDVEGKASGIEVPVAKLLGQWQGLPMTYAGGVGSMADLELLRDLGQGAIDVTIGSALDLFGGPLPYEIIKNLS